MATDAAAASGDAKKGLSKKVSTMAAAGADIIAPPKLKLKEKDPLQKQVFHS